jgi:hypothetical protein
MGPTGAAIESPSKIPFNNGTSIVITVPAHHHT